MLKPVFGLAVTGIAALLLWKLFAMFILPLFGIAIGVLLIGIKIAFWVLVFSFAWWVFKKMTRKEGMAA